MRVGQHLKIVYNINYTGIQLKNKKTYYCFTFLLSTNKIIFYLIIKFFNYQFLNSNFYEFLQINIFKQNYTQVLLNVLLQVCYSEL